MFVCNEVILKHRSSVRRLVSNKNTYIKSDQNITNFVETSETQFPSVYTLKESRNKLILSSSFEREKEREDKETFLPSAEVLLYWMALCEYFPMPSDGEKARGEENLFGK